MESPLARWRKVVDLTQPELADVSGVSQGHISKVENGHVMLGEKLKAYLKRAAGDALRVIADHETYMEEVKGGLVEGLEARIKQGTG